MNSIFKWFVDDELSPAYITWFVESFSIDCFTGIDKLLYCFLKFCDDLTLPAKKKYLETFLLSDGRGLIKKHNIRLESFSQFDYKDPAAFEEAFRVISQTAITTYELYSSVDLTDHTFKVDMYDFIQSEKRNILQEALTTAYTDLTSKSSDDTSEELAYKLDLLKEQFDTSKLEDLEFLTRNKVVMQSEEQDVNQTRTGTMRSIFYMGLPCIDEDLGPVKSKQIISIVGTPGGGKTRLAMIHSAYMCAVKSKKGVLIDEYELSANEIENIFIAYHIVNLFKGKVKIADRSMNNNALSREQLQYYQAAKDDLFHSGKYGRILIYDKRRVIQKMERQMLSFFKHNSDIELWVIDYAGMWLSEKQDKYDKDLSRAEYINAGYDTVKSILKTADVASVIVNQYNKEGIRDNDAGKIPTFDGVQGGNTVSYYSDYVVAMTNTPEQELAHISLLSTMKKRAAAGFRAVEIRKDLAVSLFTQQPRL